jgi:hypothetical protein
MLEFRPSNDAPQLELAARCNSIRDRVLVSCPVNTLLAAPRLFAPGGVAPPCHSARYGSSARLARHENSLADRARYLRDRILVGLVLFTLVRTSEVLAGDQASIANATLNADADHLHRSSPPARTLIATPDAFAAPTAAGSQTFSTTDFRPRKRTIFDSDPLVNPFSDAPMLRGTTVWQRMSEYRSHDRVRVLTLWESSDSTVSLQAGKRGDPSLQWTSRWMNRGESTRGLLDRLFSVSLAGAANRLRHADRPASAAAAPTSASVPVIAGAN